MATTPKENQVKVKQEAIESVINLTKICNHFQNSETQEETVEMSGSVSETDIGGENKILMKQDDGSGSEKDNKKNLEYKEYLIDKTDSEDEDYRIEDEEIQEVETNIKSSKKQMDDEVEGLFEEKKESESNESKTNGGKGGKHKKKEGDLVNLEKGGEIMEDIRDTKKG